MIFQGQEIDSLNQASQRNDEATADLLLLVDYNVPLEIVQGWTDDKCQLATAWASSVHLHASDNDDIEVPPIPNFLKPYGGKEIFLSGFTIVDAKASIHLDELTPTQVPTHPLPHRDNQMTANTTLMTTAEHLANVLFERMPEILNALDGDGSAPDDTEAAHAAWRAGVAEALATELALVAPESLLAPDLDRYVLVDRQELSSWETELGKKGCDIPRVRTRIIVAAAADACFPEPKTSPSHNGI